MKKSWITCTRKLCNGAALLACLSFSGCELFQEEDTCQNITHESRLWTPADGIIDFAVYTGFRIWYPRLKAGSEKYIFENVCPLSPLQLHVIVKEKSALTQYKEVAYTLWIKYMYGKFDDIALSRAFYRTGATTMELESVIIPTVLGILETSATISLWISVSVPVTGNENEGNALIWARDYFESISIEGSFTSYR